MTFGGSMGFGRSASAAVAAGLAALLATGVAAAADYVNDPLTAATFAGRGSQGGTFDATGWTTTGPTDAVWYEIPEALESGSVTYSVRGLAHGGGPLSGADHDIFTIYQAPTGFAEPVAYSPYYRDNDFKVFTRIFGEQEPGRAGAMKLEFFRCPRGVPWFHSFPCDPGCGNDDIAYANGNQNDVGWDAAAWYQMGIAWGGGTVSFSRDGVVLGSVAYSGTYAPQPLRVRLGSPRDGISDTAFMPQGITFKDLVVTGTAGVMTPACTSGAGGASGAGGTGSAGTGGASPGTELSPLADVTAASWETGVFPDVTDLNVEGDGAAPTAVVYLRFPAPPGPVAKATLRMRTHVFDSAAGITGAVHGVADATWSETTMTWATRPAFAAPAYGASTMVGADALAGWDVTQLVTAGTLNFALVSTGTDGAHFRSKEEPTGDGPKLVVELAAGGAGGASSGGAAGTSASGGAPPTGGLTASGGKSGGGPTGGGGAPTAGGKGGAGAVGGAAASGGNNAGGALVAVPSNGDTGGGSDGGCGCRVAMARERSLVPLALGLVVLASRRRRATGRRAPRAEP